MLKVFKVYADEFEKEYVFYEIEEFMKDKIEVQKKISINTEQSGRVMILVLIEYHIKKSYNPPQKPTPAVKKIPINPENSNDEKNTGEKDVIKAELHEFAISYAKEKGNRIPPSRILTLAMIEDILLKCPTSTSELRRCFGFGGEGKKVQEYGEKIVEILLRHPEYIKAKKKNAKERNIEVIKEKIAETQGLVEV